MGTQPQLCFHGLTRLVEQLWKREGGREEGQVDNTVGLCASTSTQSTIQCTPREAAHAWNHRYKVHVGKITGKEQNTVLNIQEQNSTDNPCQRPSS